MMSKPGLPLVRAHWYSIHVFKPAVDWHCDGEKRHVIKWEKHRITLMVSSQLLASRLRVVYVGREARVRRALEELSSPARASQLQADTRQSPPRSWQPRSASEDESLKIARGCGEARVEIKMVKADQVCSTFFPWQG